MKLMFILSMISSIMYFISSHPILLMTFILLQTSCLCVIGWVKLKISWFSYILFMIFLGGLMVLFIYITSLASNEMMPLKIFNFSIMNIMLMTMFLFLTATNNKQQFFNLSSEHIFKTFNFMYSNNSVLLILITMIYLLLTLVIVVKISNKFEAPIKNTIFYSSN